MSPLWRDEISIHLAPRQFRLLRLGRGLKPRVLARSEMTVDTRDYATWEPALAAIGHCLGDLTWQSANARVVLSDHWVRYAIVPWSDELRGHDERLIQARYALADVYGDLVADWTVRLSDCAPGDSQIACAMPTALFSALSDLFELRRLRVIALQPRLIAAFNRWRSSLPRSGAWFVSIEEGSLAAVRIALDGWDRVHVVRIGPDWSLELKRLQTFARLAGAKSEDGRVFVDAPSCLRDVAGTDHPALHWLQDAEVTGAQAEPADQVAGES